MFKNHVLKYIDYEKNNKLIILDEFKINNRIDYVNVLKAYGFDVYFYIDDLSFRIEKEDEFKDKNKKNAIILENDKYVPYDLMKNGTYVSLSLRNLFPKLDQEAIKDSKIDYDLLACAYTYMFITNSNYSKTKEFIDDYVLSKENVSNYLVSLRKYIEGTIAHEGYQDWFELANIKAKIKTYAIEYGLRIPEDKVNDNFKDFVLSDYGKLSSIITKDSPVIVSKVMDYIIERSKKFALIVMDGMSLFDWNIISNSFSDISYKESNVIAMIPSVTSVSRQCLLSNKYPVQLINPWSQSKEKQEFINYAKDNGYLEHQISYQRGYDVELNPNIDCLAIIINEIDDMVHGQKQGNEGMFDDITLMTKQKKLVELTKRLLNTGFDVYISSDHGNTSCTGIGSFRTGVETETKGKRMLVLKEIADKDSLLEKYPLIDFPKYYLDKQYEYLICDNGISFDNRGEEVMTHGGISIEELIVPFISIRMEDN